VSKTATIVTSKGTIVADLFDQEVSATVANFEKLANSEFYDGTRFHRVIANFMIQGGDPLSRDVNNPRVGTGGPVLQTVNVTRVGAAWSTTAASLADGSYTVQAIQSGGPVIAPMLTSPSVPFRSASISVPACRRLERAAWAWRKRWPP